MEAVSRWTSPLRDRAVCCIHSLQVTQIRTSPAEHRVMPRPRHLHDDRVWVPYYVRRCYSGRNCCLLSLLSLLCAVGQRVSSDALNLNSTVPSSPVAAPHQHVVCCRLGSHAKSDALTPCRRRHDWVHINMGRKLIPRGATRPSGKPSRSLLLRHWQHAQHAPLSAPDAHDSSLPAGRRRSMSCTPAARVHGCVPHCQVARVDLHQGRRQWVCRGR